MTSIDFLPIWKTLSHSTYPITHGKRKSSRRKPSIFISWSRRSAILYIEYDYRASIKERSVRITATEKPPFRITSSNITTPPNVLDIRIYEEGHEEPHIEDTQKRNFKSAKNSLKSLCHFWNPDLQMSRLFYQQRLPKPLEIAIFKTISPKSLS